MDTQIQQQVGQYDLELNPVRSLIEQTATRHAALLHPVIARNGSDVGVVLPAYQKIDGKPEVYGEAGEEYINRLIGRGGSLN